MSTPQQLDTALADLYYERQKLSQRQASAVHTALSAAGAKYYYRGRKRVTDMTAAEAISKLSASRNERNLSYGKTHEEILAEIDAVGLQLLDNENQAKALEEQYTGWSRFFVVTSSAGHIHSSTYCSTCRPTTTYGWLPELSGKSQEEAIAHFGPAAEALCSVCFPDAPVANKDQNLTAKQRDALLAGQTPEPEAKKVYCPGSGQPSATPVNWRRMTPSGRCPHCKHFGAVTQSGAMRKHKEES